MPRRKWPGKPEQWPAIPERARETITVRDGAAKRRSEFWFAGHLVGTVWWDGQVPGIASSIRRGVLDGLRVEYIDGRVSYTEPFVNGLEHGWAKQYARSGELLIASPFKRGTGTDYWCDDEGRLSEEHPLVRGKPSGVERWWSSEHTIYEETYWLDGVWHGPKRHWREGKLERGFPRFFIRGKRRSKRAYLKACAVDPALPGYRPEDDLPERALPRAFLRLRAKVGS